MPPPRWTGWTNTGFALQHSLTAPVSPSGATPQRAGVGRAGQGRSLGPAPSRVYVGGGARPGAVCAPCRPAQPVSPAPPPRLLCLRAPLPVCLSCRSVSDSATLSLCLLLLSPPGRGGIQLDMGEAGTKGKELGLSSRLGGGAQSARDAGPLPPGPLVPVEGSRQGGRGAPRFPLLATVWCPSHQSPPPSWGSSLPAPSVHLGSVRLPACPHTPCLSSSPSPPPVCPPVPPMVSPAPPRPPYPRRRDAGAGAGLH